MWLCPCIALIHGLDILVLLPPVDRLIVQRNTPLPQESEHMQRDVSPCAAKFSQVLSGAGRYASQEMPAGQVPFYRHLTISIIRNDCMKLT